MDHSNPRYIVGIDLGTTNCALAYIDTQPLLNPRGELELSMNSSQAAAPEPQVLPIPQVVAPGQVEARPTLPSFLYLAVEKEFPKKALDLPWAAERDYVVGELARQHGGQSPMRLISSAKSWLSCTTADPTTAILPFSGGAVEEEGPRISPVEASARYLTHLRDAWDQRFAVEGKDDALRLEHQQVFLTVPASFDAVARDLTVRAAQMAGLPRATLLEEPQAAFYAWLSKHAATWRQHLRVGDVVLVCDVGGGTTDFSLIAVTEEQGELQLARIAVGDHLLLGGDNMDLALAATLMRRLEQQGHKLDPWQRRALVLSCRHAKEGLLTHGGQEAATVTVLGRGSKVIGGSVKTELKRADVEALLLDGFLPQVAAAERPRAARRSGLAELGLPYASDAAITKHLAKFLGDHRLPTAVLFNGGVMKAAPLRQRIEEVLGSWAGQGSMRTLIGQAQINLDLAVAEGAAYYGLVRRGKGLRIRGGTARSYYIGVASAMPAIPGEPPPMNAVCVAPRGMEEGTTADLPGRELGLIVGEPVEFRFLSSSTRKKDRLGALIEDAGADLEQHELTELAPVVANMPPSSTDEPGTLVPVRLRSHLNEVGVLELYCVSRQGDRQWKLQYDTRERPEDSHS